MAPKHCEVCGRDHVEMDCATFAAAQEQLTRRLMEKIGEEQQTLEKQYGARNAYVLVETALLAAAGTKGANWSSPLEALLEGLAKYYTVAHGMFHGGARGGEPS